MQTTTRIEDLATDEQIRGRAGAGSAGEHPAVVSSPSALRAARISRPRRAILWERKRARTDEHPVLATPGDRELGGRVG